VGGAARFGAGEARGSYRVADGVERDRAARGRPRGPRPHEQGDRGAALPEHQDRGVEPEPRLGSSASGRAPTSRVATERPRSDPGRRHLLAIKRRDSVVSSVVSPAYLRSAAGSLAEHGDARAPREQARGGNGDGSARIPRSWHASSTGPVTRARWTNSRSANARSSVSSPRGRSNSGIANFLVLSPKTVEAHVGRISKLGLDETPDRHRRVLAVLAFLRA
jgi:hypothetical protein